MSLMLNINAMNYRASSSDEWSPLTIMANADIPAITEQFSTANTYVVGDYVLYNNQLYRCTTAITSAGAWDSTAWILVTIGNELATLNAETKNDVLYFTNVACSATTGDIAAISNSAITADHILTSCIFAAPSYITTNVTWTTSSGSCVLNGTCTAATTADILLVKKDN